MCSGWIAPHRPLLQSSALLLDSMPASSGPLKVCKWPQLSLLLDSTVTMPCEFLQLSPYFYQMFLGSLSRLPGPDS